MVIFRTCGVGCQMFLRRQVGKQDRVYLKVDPDRSRRGLRVKLVIAVSLEYLKYRQFKRVLVTVVLT
jgi:hypothetical protein